MTGGARSMDPPSLASDAVYLQPPRPPDMAEASIGTFEVRLVLLCTQSEKAEAN